MTESYSRAANLLGALALAVPDRLREAAGQHEDGLVASEPAVLVTLAHYPGQSILSLPRTLGGTHSGAVRPAGRMTVGGLVYRTGAGLGRLLALHLTGRGQHAAQRVLARRQTAAGQLASLLDAAETAALDHLADRLLAAIATAPASARRLCRLRDEPLCASAGCPAGRAARG